MSGIFGRFNIEYEFGRQLLARLPQFLYRNLRVSYRCQPLFDFGFDRRRRSAWVGVADNAEDVWIRTGHKKGGDLMSDAREPRSRLNDFTIEVLPQVQSGTTSQHCLQEQENRVIRICGRRSAIGDLKIIE